LLAARVIVSWSRLEAIGGTHRAASGFGIEFFPELADGEVKAGAPANRYGATAAGDSADSKTGAQG
jgi:hypothetical protein